MDLHLTNKVAVITGASRGIGRSIAQTLSAEGMRLVIAARSADALAAVAQSCATEVATLALDLRPEAGPQQLIDYAISQFGSIDVLVNNAGATKRGDFFALSEDDWRDGFALKFFSAVRCSRAAWPHLMASRGAIVNIVGIGGRTGSAEFAIGGSVNAALLNLTKVLADRGVKEGVRVNAINPGSIVTDRLQQRIKAFAVAQQIDLPEAALQMAAQAGIARFGQSVEIAQAVAFLASPAAAYCQGAIIDIDGGQTRTL
ncbi:MAG: SDR family oxidoreductase [Chloroflexota bacterium]|jgi:3-oxoacyl-[acyl-carrier protein] reductase|nr:SDR family oxidoreductase [Chloroflexota bacterium]